jgi:hypothetical protein
MCDQFHGLPHLFEARPFERRMWVMLARGQVRSWKSAGRQLRAIGTATNACFLGLPSQSLVRRLGEFDGTRFLFQPIAQIAVLRLDVNVNVRAGQRPLDVSGQSMQKLGLFLEPAGFKVAQNDL